MWTRSKRRVAAYLWEVLRLAGKILYWAGAARLLAYRSRNSPKVVLYHACEPSESDYTRGLNCNTPPLLFREHVDFYARYYSVISLDDIERGHRPAGSLLITFDDGYRSVWEGACPVLKERRLPAVLFLVSEVVGNRKLVWVNELIWFLRRRPKLAVPATTSLLGMDSSAMPEELIQKAQASCQHDQLMQLLASLREAAGVEGEQLAADASLYVTRDDLDSMAAVGFAFGNHTASHASLTQVDKGALDSQVRECRDFIDDVGGHRAFAYPFGNVNEAAELCVARLEHSTSFLVGGVNKQWDPLRIARIPISTQSVAGVFAEIEVVTPIKAWANRVIGTQPR